MSKQSREQGRTERAAAVRAEQARKERNRRVLTVVGIIVLLGAVVAAGAWYGGGSSTSDASSTTASSSSMTAGPASLTLGKADAPVKIVVYEDFLCPFCRELETSTRDFLAENADKGNVQVTYQPINLLQQYPYSAKALNAWAAVLKHASPAAALKLHNLLYDHQPYEQASGQVTDSQIAAWVKQAGADSAAVRDAMKSQDTTFFDAAQQAMTQAHISGTPTVFINGKELPVTAVTTMVSQIEAAVQQGS
jgi:protein-disulfide isomerase